jgi:hypothetical protein
MPPAKKGGKQPGAPAAPAADAAAAAAEAELARADAAQRAMMEERVIMTDFFDNAIGHESKKDCV